MLWWVMSDYYECWKAALNHIIFHLDYVAIMNPNYVSNYSTILEKKQLFNAIYLSEITWFVVLDLLIPFQVLETI